MTPLNPTQFLNGTEYDITPEGQTAEEVVEFVRDILFDYDGNDPNNAEQLRSLIDDIVGWTEHWLAIPKQKRIKAWVTRFGECLSCGYGKDEIYVIVVPLPRTTEYSQCPMCGNQTVLLIDKGE